MSFESLSSQPSIGDLAFPRGERKCARACGVLLLLSVLLAGASTLQAGLLFNEILFNPPFNDATNEYVELRGSPNLVIPKGTYLLSVEGDSTVTTNGSPGAIRPGTVQNIFDLGGQRVGQSGFLVLLQKYHRYKPLLYSSVISNTNSSEGWGSGSSSSLGHRGEGGQIELENASCTFFLIQTTNAPSIGDDIDLDDDGAPDGTNFMSWTVLDSVGILDSTGAGDIAYGLINFRSDDSPGNLATAANTIIPVPFTPGYVARNGNSSGWDATDWVASDNLSGKPPRWSLGKNSSSASVGTNTHPYKPASASLNNLGGPNFKAPILPSVILRESRSETVLPKNGKKDYYTLNLSINPTGAVNIQIDAQYPAQVSIDSGKTYRSTQRLELTRRSAKKIVVRAVDDGFAGPSQLKSLITHTVSSSFDDRFPINTLILPVVATVLDTNIVLLSEAKVNPPGEDAPFEFVEIKGPPNKVLTNLHLLSVQGNDSSNPGRVDTSIDLSGRQIGSDGLLIIAAAGHPYAFSSNATVLLAPQMTNSGGALDNGSVSLLLVGAREPILEGTDLDNGNNGTLERLPVDAFIVDAIAWKDAGSSDVIYGGVDLTQRGFTPDAASRFPWDNSPRSASAWFVGDLVGSTGDSLAYDPVSISTNLPPGSVMTPGIVNRKAPRLSPSPIPGLSGVIGDPENETLTFTLSVLEDDDDNFDKDNDPDDYIPATALTVTVRSTNQTVVPDANLTLTNLAPGKWNLAIEPIGVGYTEIVIRATDGIYTRHGFLEYAASDQGRLGARWHTGISDASTAIAIDEDWMFVGDDENQSLRIFSRKSSGGPVAVKDYNPFLNIVDFYDDGRPREVDIEGSTRVGNRIYWIGSHSHAFNATERTNRARLFATDVSRSGTNSQLKVIAHYDFLKLDLLEWDASNHHGKGANYYGFALSAAEGTDPKTPDGSGFNIEGLCMAPGANNKLTTYIAFRAPLVPTTGDDARTRALLIPVLNFGTLATKHLGPGSAQFGPPIELNLGGRGVRSIEGHGGTNYLIVAGPPGAGPGIPPPGDFRLFTWTGDPTNQPLERMADVSLLNLEGIVEVPGGVWTPTNQFQIISDSGTNVYYADGIQAKHMEEQGKPAAFKKFRVDTITLGDTTNAVPLVRYIATVEEGLKVNWFTIEGITYRLQKKTALSDEWADVPGQLTATTSASSMVIPTAPDQQCYFRVIAVE